MYISFRYLWQNESSARIQYCGGAIVDEASEADAW